jgi:ABC-type glycerol-3-phosphate transport system substrate-binding protein
VLLVKGGQTKTLEDKRMKKIIMLFMLLALSLGTFSCGGGGAGSADTPGGEKHGVASVVRLSPSQYIAQTNSFIFLHAQVFDGNGTPVAGTVVTFKNLYDPFGQIN